MRRSSGQSGPLFVAGWLYSLSRIPSSHWLDVTSLIQILIDREGASIGVYSIWVSISFFFSFLFPFFFILFRVLLFFLYFLHESHGCPEALKSRSRFSHQILTRLPQTVNWTRRSSRKRNVCNVRGTREFVVTLFPIQFFNLALSIRYSPFYTNTTSFNHRIQHLMKLWDSQRNVDSIEIN